MTRVVHCRREKFDVYIGRPSVYGNPFSVAAFGRAGAMKRFREWFALQIQKADFRAAVEKLRDKTLGCWCKDKPHQECHGDVYVEYLDGKVKDGLF